MNTHVEHVERACKAASKSGTQAELARLIGVSPAVVNQWLKSIRMVPDEKCPDIERVTKGAVRADQLRPDVRWSRLKDADWPHPEGRPVIDPASPRAKVSAPITTANAAEQGA